MEIHNTNQVFQKGKYQRLRPKSAFVTSLHSSDNQMKQFSTNLFTQISNHLNIGCQEKVDDNSRKNLQDEEQPPSSGIKWKASKVKPKQEVKKSVKLVPQRKLRNFERISFGTKFEKFENQQLHCMKFPSQKTLLSKEKVLPIKRPQKQKYVVEICRIFKQNCNTIFAENSKENQAFVTHQVQKYRQIKTDSKNKNPIVTFNYDGSILTVHPLKKTGAQTIQCTAKQALQAVIKPLHPSHENKKEKNIKDEDIKNYDQIQKISSKYIDNFKNIDWNPKITVINQEDSQLNPSKLYRNKNQKTHENDNLFDVGEYHRCRANTLKLKNQNQDQKSIIRIQNHQAYKQQLLIKTQQALHYRSASCDFSQQFPINVPRGKTDEIFYRKKSKVHQKQILDLPKKDQKSEARKRSFHIPARKEESKMTSKNYSNLSSTRIHNGKMADFQSNGHVQIMKVNFLAPEVKPSTFVRSKSAHVKNRKNNQVNESLIQTQEQNGKDQSLKYNQSQLDSFQIYSRKQQNKTNKTVKEILKKFKVQKTPSNQRANIKKSITHQRATTKIYS